MRDNFSPVIFVIALLLTFSIQAQQIANISVTSSGNQIQIKYDLTGLPNNRSVFVSVHCSEDNGLSWTRALQKVSGDVGDNVKGNGSKTIVWDVLAEWEKLVGSEVIFEIWVSLNPIAANNTPPKKNSDTKPSMAVFGVGYISNNKVNGFNLFIAHPFGVDFSFFVGDVGGLNIAFILGFEKVPFSADLGFGFYKTSGIGISQIEPEVDFANIGFTWHIRPLKSKQFIFYVQARYAFYLNMVAKDANYSKPSDLGITPFQLGVGIGARTLRKK